MVEIEMDEMKNERKLKKQKINQKLEGGNFYLKFNQCDRHWYHIYL